MSYFYYLKIHLPWTINRINKAKNYYIISKTFIFQFAEFFASLVALSEQIFEILRPLFESLVNLLTPLKDFFLDLVSLIDLSLYQDFLDALYFLERLVTKTIIYIFILDWSRISAVSSQGSTKIKQITKSGLTLSNLRELTILQSINYLSTISMLTVLFFEFLFIFIDLAIGIDLGVTIDFLLTTIVWTLVLISQIRNPTLETS